MKKSFPQSLRSVLSSLGLVCFLALASNGLAAEVITDQFDYNPGDTVIILGTGFAPGETVFFQVAHAEGEGLSSPYGDPWTAVADQDGNVITTWEVCPEECFEAVLHLMALGETSNEFAETFFTDAIFTQRVVSVVSQSGACVRSEFGGVRVSVQPGGTFLVTVVSAGSGTPPPCYSNDPPAITVFLGTNFGSTTFVLDRVPNTNLYRGSVTIPIDACGTTFLTVFCDNGSARRLLGGGSTTNVMFVAARFPSGCAGSAFPITCGSTGQPPTITCPANITTTSTNVLCGARVFYPPPTATGNPQPIVLCNPPSGSFFPVGIRTVTCRATNSFGVAQCSFSIRVIDDDPPVITCTDVCLATFVNACSASSLDLPQPVVSDNCGLGGPGGTNRVIVANDAPESLPIGTTIVTWTATDPAGNSASCQQRVTVVSGITVTFLSPLEGPNIPEISHGQTVPVKVQLRDCTGALVSDGLTATLRVEGMEAAGGEEFVFDSVIEQANGSGISGSAEADGTLELHGIHEHFNLDTSNFLDPNTAANHQRFYRLTVNVFDEATGCLAGTGVTFVETR